MPNPPRFEVHWTLTVEAVDEADATSLAEALRPESQGHHELDVDGATLVATGTGGLGATLHTVDDLLACLAAALGALDA